jgi:hypothetical protein
MKTTKELLLRWIELMELKDFKSFKDEHKVWIELYGLLEKISPIAERERNAWKSKLFLTVEQMEEVAEIWDGTQTVSGRLRHVDRKDWKAIIQTDENSYLLIDVAKLKVTNEIAARNLAKTFSENKFPRSGFSFGSTTISIHGHVTFESSRLIESLPDSYERQRAEHIS